VVVKEIGRGAFGKVCSYRQRETQWFAPQRNSLPDEMAVKAVMPDSTEISRELEILMNVSHKNIIQFLGVSAKGDLLYIKMELANSDLSVLKHEMEVSKFRADAVRLLVYQILCGLDYLHEKLISHRDLKPKNILAFWKAMDTGNVPLATCITLKLSDFGLSRFVNDISLSATAVGTRHYMAPEVALAFHSQEKFHGDYKMADVFSVGVIAYEMLHGKRPFTEKELLGGEKTPITCQCNGAEEKVVMENVEEMLKWTYKDRCNAKFAKNKFCPKVS
jgi:serine/threonine protein kinase